MVGSTPLVIHALYIVTHNHNRVLYSERRTEVEVEPALIHSLFESLIGLLHETSEQLDPYSAQYPDHIQFDRNENGSNVSYHISMETITVQLPKGKLDEIGLYLIYEGTPFLAKSILVMIQQMLQQTTFLETMIYHDFYPNISLPIDMEEGLSLLLRKASVGS